MSTIVGTATYDGTKWTATEAGDKIKVTLDALNAVTPFTLETLAGDDPVTVYGDGSMVLNTGAGNDKVLYFGSGTLTLLLGAGDDTFTAAASGQSYSVDTVKGGPGNDAISTAHGDDWLFGGTGNDTLAGGDGADAFYYPFFMEADGIKSHCEIDTIKDFEVGVDKLLFSGISSADYATYFEVTQYDAFGQDGINDSSSLTLVSDPSFAINLQNVLINEANLFNSILWA
jgi:Ca2+-binding RTX toxin-like protein